MSFKDTPGLMDAAIEQSDYSVVITTAELDAPGPVIVYVNSAFTRITGYTREEVLGATPRLLQGPATDRSVLDRLKSTLRAGDSFQGFTWNYAKNGTPYQVEWTVTPLRLEGERIDYFLSVQRDVTAQNQTHEKLKDEARRLNALLHSVGADNDVVTGALNYRGMLLRLQQLIDDTEATASTTGLVALQLRRLNRIDQAFGIEAVNQLLSDIAELLHQRLETSESLARSHEHTFMILIPVDLDATDNADHHLMARARTLVAAVAEKNFSVAGEIVQVEVGAGIARAPTDSRDTPRLAVLAEAAAQRTTNTDVDPVRWADSAAMAAQRGEIALERNLRHAITERQLVLFYQPVIDLSNGKVVGAEALARWPQPEGHSPIGPDCFIPLAEELGLMDRLGTQVFEDACYQLKRWQERPGNAQFWVSVNVAPVQLRDPTLAERFIAIVQATGVSPAYVKLEITESALEHGLDEVSEVLGKLVAIGFSLALDDFGTGHSSLRRLIDIPFSILKADKSFVAQLPDGRGAAVVSSLSVLSNHLKLDALGEGVETAAHEAFLRDCNYRYAQGFYYAKPMGTSDFAAWAGWPEDSES